MTKTAVVILRRPAKQKQQARHRALSLRETDSGRECANLKQNKLCFHFMHNGQVLKAMLKKTKKKYNYYLF